MGIPGAADSTVERQQRRRLQDLGWKPIRTPQTLKTLLFKTFLLKHQWPGIYPENYTAVME